MQGGLDLQRNFGHLPPNQQKNELNRKLTQLREEVQKKSKELYVQFFLRDFYR